MDDTLQRGIEELVSKTRSYEKKADVSRSHAWRKEGSFIKVVIKKDPAGKIPSGKPRLRWEDRIKKDVKAVEPNILRRDIFRG